MYIHCNTAHQNTGAISAVQFTRGHMRGILFMQIRVIGEMSFCIACTINILSKSFVLVIFFAIIVIIDDQCFCCSHCNAVIIIITFIDIIFDHTTDHQKLSIVSGLSSVTAVMLIAIMMIIVIVIRR